MAKIKNSSILITGATGFIGSNLVEYLKDINNKLSLFVLDFDNFNLDKFPNNSKIYMGNLSNYQDCLRIISRANPEIIIHLAAQPLVTATSTLDTMESNVRGSYNLLQAVVDAGKSVKAILWVSTDKVYGIHSDELVEETELLGIEHPYDVSKLCGDLLARSYAEYFNLPIVVVRSGNIYGERDFHWDRLIPGVVSSVLSGKSPTIRSNGKYRRDYIYIKDILRGYISAISGVIFGDIKHGEVINFGAKSSSSVLDVVDIILAECGRIDLKPKILNITKGEIPNQHVNYEKAASILSWNPEISLDVGINKTVAWYKNYFGY